MFIDESLAQQIHQERLRTAEQERFARTLMQAEHATPRPSPDRSGLLPALLAALLRRSASAGLRRA